MKTLIFSLVSIMMMPAAMAGAGFSNGNDIDITTYHGRIHVRCNGPYYKVETHYCSAADFNPGARDSFLADQWVDADQVELTAFHEDGSKRKKKEKFDSNKGLSGKFNLLISTLFQRPLLEVGLNRVEYELKDGRRTVASGEFNSSVEVVDELRCPDMWTSAFGSSCDNGAAACSEYFNRVTGCQ